MFIAKKYLSYFCCIKVECFLAKFNTKLFSTFFDFYCFLETLPKILVFTHFARVVIFGETRVTYKNMSICFHYSLHFCIGLVYVFEYFSHVSKFSNPMIFFKMFIQFVLYVAWSSNSLARTFPRKSQRT